MDIQQVLALGIAALCSAYLMRQSAKTIQRWRNSSSSCGACGKCSYAPKDDQPVATPSVISRDSLLTSKRPTHSKR